MAQVRIDPADGSAGLAATVCLATTLTAYSRIQSTVSPRVIDRVSLDRQLSRVVVVRPQ
jgi:hypothetical protein